jgi:phosphatidylglycerophosphate synthase
MDNPDNRRPLAVRERGLAKKTAHWLSQQAITPNQISIASVLFAAASAACLLWMPHAAPGTGWIMPLLAAVFIQLRLLCNLFDGMVAVEGGKKTLSGELFNDIPDRIADPLILVAAGYASTAFGWSAALGWCAGLLAVMTAYVRTLSASAGAPVDFRGPMAKQHRMALMTGACVVAAVEAAVSQTAYTLPLALALVVLGAVVTVYRRTVAAYRYLEGNPHV